MDMLDELLEGPLTTEEMEDIYGGVPGQRIGHTRLAMVPRRYVTKHFDKAMAWAENWAEENFGVSEVSLFHSGDEVIFAPALHRSPVRHQ